MNIKEYEFSESSLYCIEDYEDKLVMDTGYDIFTLNKNDTIAIAEHFKLECKEF